MDSLAAFYSITRADFPDLAQGADQHYLALWGEAAAGDRGAFVWFESLAHVVNRKMQNAVFDESEAFFRFMDEAFRSGGEEVRKCIDASLIENLFWQVTPKAARAYWRTLPNALRKLYVDFHGRRPL